MLAYPRNHSQAYAVTRWKIQRKVHRWVSLFWEIRIFPNFHGPGLLRFPIIFYINRYLYIRMYLSRWQWYCNLLNYILNDLVYFILFLIVCIVFWKFSVYDCFNFIFKNKSLEIKAEKSCEFSLNFLLFKHFFFFFNIEVMDFYLGNFVRI